MNTTATAGISPAAADALDGFGLRHGEHWNLDADGRIILTPAGSRTLRSSTAWTQHTALHPVPGYTHYVWGTSRRHDHQPGGIFTPLPAPTPPAAAGSEIRHVPAQQLRAGDHVVWYGGKLRVVKAVRSTRIPPYVTVRGLVFHSWTTLTQVLFADGYNEGDEGLSMPTRRWTVLPPE